MSGTNEVLTQEPAEDANMKRDPMSRERILLLLGVFALELVVFFAAMVIPIDQATQQSLQQVVDNLRNTTSNASPLVVMETLFSTNVRVALVEMIPAVGALIFFVSIFTTGQLIQVLALSNGLPGVLYGILLFIFPYSIIEFSAYPLAAGSGSMVIVAWRRKRLRREAPVFGLELVGVVVILLIAAAMETATLLSPAIGLALWFPTGLFIAWLLVRGRRGIV